LKILITLIPNILMMVFLFFSDNFGQHLSEWSWTQTTEEDFLQNDIDDLIITESGNGEIQLPHPMVKTIQDYRNDSVHRFISRSKNGDYLRSWLENGNIYLQKYSIDGNAIGTTIRANDENGIMGDRSIHRSAIMDDGHYLVAWANLGEHPDGVDKNMYGQIFDPENEKIDSNFQINQSENFSAHFPVVFANEEDNSFWILYSLKSTDGYRIFVQKRNLLGTQDGEIIQLETGKVTINESQPAVIDDSLNNFVVTWNGNNENSNETTDLFVRNYNNGGEPISLTLQVNDDLQDVGEDSKDICMDNQGNYLIVWRDSRDLDWYILPYDFNIYGQYFYSENKQVGKNFLINEHIHYEDGEPDVDYFDGKFIISYNSWNDSKEQSEIYVSEWSYKPTNSGNMSSIIFDTGPGGSDFENISWVETLTSNSLIKIKIRSAGKRENLEEAVWYGPLGSSGYYNISNGEQINTIHDNDRFIQYKSFFNSEVDGSTPILHSVLMSYTPSDTIAPLAPQGLESIPGHSKIELNWGTNLEPDISKYRIYRGTVSNNYDSSWTIELSYSETSFTDTSAENGRSYYYSVTAVDSSHNESNYSKEISANPIGMIYYVSADANEQGDGSYDSPFATINSGLKRAIYGDEVLVLPGIYFERITLMTGISLRSTGSENTIIESIDSENMIEMYDNTSLKGFTIIKSHSGWENAILCSGASIKIDKNVLINKASSTIGSHAVYSRYSSVEIHSNYISNFDVGISVNAMPELRDSRVSVISNIIKCSTGINIHPYGNNVKIVNNTIICPENGFGIYLRDGNEIYIKNSIIVGSSTKSGIGMSVSGISDISCAFNNVWNLKSNYVNIDSGEGAISTDPLFVDFSNEDFRLQKTSPCINSGDPNSAYSDIDGTRNDMGAFGGPKPFEILSNVQSVKQISSSNISGFPGDTVISTISLQSAIGLKSGTFALTFNPELLRAIDAKLTETTSRFLIIKVIKPGSIEIEFESRDGIESGNPEILKISFVINDSAISGEGTPLSFTGLQLLDDNFNIVYLSSISEGVLIVNLGSETGNFIYVDSKNSGIEDGSRLKPFNTIQEGIDFAASGDTVVVASGNYYGHVLMKENVYLRGAGAKVTKIIKNSEAEIMLFPSLNDAEVSGFSFHSDQDPPEGPFILCQSSSPLITKNFFEGSFSPGVWGVRCENQSKPTIKENVFNEAGLFVSESSPVLTSNKIIAPSAGGIGIECINNSSPVIEKNKLISSLDNGAIIIDESSPTIRNNWLVCNEFNGMGLDLSNSSNVIITNNILEDLGNSGVGINIRNSSEIQVLNNSIITSGQGIYEVNSSSIIYNNIIDGNREFGVQISGTSNLDYNNVWNNSVGYNNCSAGTNDISIDPLYINRLESNFSLSPNSPCIDSGHPDFKYNDKDDSRNDIGAFGGPYSYLEWLNSEASSLLIDSLIVNHVDTISFSLTGEFIKGIAGADISLTYDSEIVQFLDAHLTSLTNTFALTKSRNGNNSLQLLMNSPIGIKEESGDVLTLKFSTFSHNTVISRLKFQNVNLIDELNNTRRIKNLQDGVIKIVTDINNIDRIPKSFNISQNYPNPFNPSTKINYSIPEKVFVELNIYDILGRKIKNLVNEEQSPGNYNIGFDAVGLASGIYFYRIRAGNFLRTRKMILLR